MIDILKDTTATLQYLRKLLGLQLFTGPYIGGSFLTYHFERRYREPAWFPRDIDIICKNVDQLNHVESVLRPLSSSFVESPSDVNGNDYPDLRALEFYFSGQETYIGVDTILNSSDVFEKTNRQFGEFTVNSFFSDGRDVKCDLRAWHDIEHQILQLREPEKCVPGLVHPRQLKRFRKYRSRGYVDVNSTTETLVKTALGKL